MEGRQEDSDITGATQNLIYVALESLKRFLGLTEGLNNDTTPFLIHKLLIFFHKIYRLT